MEQWLNCKLKSDGTLTLSLHAAHPFGPEHDRRRAIVGDDQAADLLTEAERRAIVESLSAPLKRLGPALAEKAVAAAMEHHLNCTRRNLFAKKE